MKKVTSATMWNDAVGARLSITYSEISDAGVITSDNKRIDRIITDSDAQTAMTTLMSYAQSCVDSEE
jgi:hypothetical protein